MNPYHRPILSAAADDTGASCPTDTSGALSEAKTKIAQTARATASKVKAAASDTASRAKEEAERVATEKKQTAADRLGNYSSAIHESARSLEEKDPNIAWFTHRAADRLQGVAEYVRNRDFTELRRDAEDIARRHPAAFFGGMFLAGLFLGNVVKATRRNREDEGDERDTETPESTREEGLAPTPELTEAERSAAGI